MKRPGPPWIEPHAYPGGVVVMVYTLTDDGPYYVMTTKLRDGADRASSSFLLASLIGADAPVYLVTYDGDTGERLIPARTLDRPRTIPE